MKVDRFKLEEEIQECWGVTTEIDNLLFMIDNSDKIDEDELMNFLIGMKAIYNVKFQKLFKTFETLISERKIT